MVRVIRLERVPASAATIGVLAALVATMPFLSLLSLLRRLPLLRRLGGLRVLLVCAAALPLPALAQGVDDLRLRVFLDCPSGGCDRNYLVTELPFALWTQDRLDADIHLLITRIGTASGGGEYTYTLLGQRRFASRVDTLVGFLPPNTTDELRRREMARVIKIGLAPFALRLPGGERFSVQYTAPANESAAPALSSLKDPWDFWVYRMRANGGGNAESRSSSYEVNTNVNASRVTEDLKVSFNAGQQYRDSRFTLSDGSERRFSLRSADASARIVKSIDDHWSIGTRAGTAFSEFSNTQASASLDLSAEYNWYRWAEATSRQLVALVAVGGRYNDYFETSIYGRNSEVLPVGLVVVAGESRQVWGTIDAQARYTRYLHDTKTYSMNFTGRTNFRLSRGLSLELRGDAAKVNDQLYLPRGDATNDEVLTRQRALATAYRLSGSVGLSFTFGSIYNTVVNPRMDDMDNR